jgi:hypothetical protein
MLVGELVKDFLVKSLVSFVMGNLEHLIVRMLLAMDVGPDGFDDDEAWLFWHVFSFSYGKSISMGISERVPISSGSYTLSAQMIGH